MPDLDALSVTGSGIESDVCVLDPDTTAVFDEYYVSPSGNDASSGTISAPFATMAHAQTVVAPGDTVYFRGGVYYFTGSSDDTGVVLDKNGLPGRRIHYVAYGGESPVFDFTSMSAPARLRGILVTADWIHIEGMELRGVQQTIASEQESWGVLVMGGNNNLFEQLVLRGHEGPGLSIESGSDNLVLNCDAYDNYDADNNGQYADGFRCGASGMGNVFSGCRAWNNSSDGFDFTDASGVCTAQNSWAFNNGMNLGSGVGFRGGGFSAVATPEQLANPARHVIQRCVSYGNKAQGFYANQHTGGCDWINNTAFDNSVNFDMEEHPSQGTADHYLRNNIASGSTALANSPALINSAYNSWELPVTATSTDFVSVSGASATRQSDGSLPDNGFIDLVSGSDLIDKGEAQPDQPYNGSAPDLGAKESD